MITRIFHLLLNQKFIGYTSNYNGRNTVMATQQLADISGHRINCKQKLASVR